MMSAKSIGLNRAACLAAMLLVPGWAAADEQLENPLVWLERMAHASRTLDYQGTFVYERGDQIQTLRVVHDAGESGERERLITLDGPAREVVRDARRVTCVLPGDGSVVIEKGAAAGGLSLAIPAELDGISDHYGIVAGGVARIADREARHVSLRPRDVFRYGHEFWVDMEHGLLLKSELVDASGGVLERVMFTSLQLLDGVPDQLLQPMALDDNVTRYREGARMTAVEPADWHIDALPAGFHLASRRRHHIPTTERDMEHLLFTDGLASVSVFIESHAEADETGEGPFLGSGRSGPVSAFARVINGHRVTVVGEVPLATVELVGASVSRGTQ